MKTFARTKDERPLRRWTLFLPVAALTVFAGYLGLRMGQPPSEGEIIERSAALYLSRAPDGARATDCVGRPGEPPVRIVVTCAHPNGATFEIMVDARGQPVFHRRLEDPSA